MQFPAAALISLAMPYEAPPNLDGLSLAEISELVAQRKLPPVSSWNPEQSGDSEMRIAADGKWYHQGGQIKRPAMVRAFSSLLRRDAQNDYWLVTPQQKLSIIVDEAPFIATEMTVKDGEKGNGKDQRLAFRVNSDDLVIAGADHAISVEDRGAGQMPYLHVRDNLWAKLARPVFYELAELALENAGNGAGNGDDDGPAVWSSGTCFSLAAML